MIWTADRLALGEAKRVFTNSQNVADRLWNSIRLGPRRSTTRRRTSRRSGREPGPYGDYVLYPEPHGGSEASVARRRGHAAHEERRSLVLVGRGPDEPALRQQAKDLGRRRAGRVRDRARRRAAARALPGGARRLLRPVRRGLRVHHDRGVRRAPAGHHAHRRRRPARVRDRRRRPGSWSPPEPKAIAEAIDRLWTRRGARQAARRGGLRRDGGAGADAGRRSSPGCWTDGLGGSRARARRRDGPANAGASAACGTRSCIRGWGSSRRCLRPRPASRPTRRRCSRGCGASGSATATTWTSSGRSSRSTRASSRGTRSASTSSATTSSSIATSTGSRARRPASSCCTISRWTTSCAG